MASFLLKPFICHEARGFGFQLFVSKKPSTCSTLAPLTVNAFLVVSKPFAMLDRMQCLIRYHYGLLLFLSKMPEYRWLSLLNQLEILAEPTFHAFESLERHISDPSIHAGMLLNEERINALMDFKGGKCCILIYSHLASRGIDIFELHL